MPTQIFCTTSFCIILGLPDQWKFASYALGVQLLSSFDQLEIVFGIPRLTVSLLSAIAQPKGDVTSHEELQGSESILCPQLRKVFHALSWHNNYYFCHIFQRTCPLPGGASWLTVATVAGFNTLEGFTISRLLIHVPLYIVAG